MSDERRARTEGTGDGRADLRYTSAPVRRTRILELLAADPYLSLADLSRRLGVSEMTIRRDARALEEHGLVRVVVGGLTLPLRPLAQNAFEDRADRHLLAKRRIARTAASMVEPHSTIAVDAGTTALELVQELDPQMPLTVVTASLPVQWALRDHAAVTLIGLGGAFRARTQAFSGPATIDALRQLHVTQFFLGAAAVDARGTYEGNPWESAVKQAMIDAADAVVLIADASKFARSAVARVVPLSDVSTAVVDDALDEAHREMLVAAGVQVVVAADQDMLMPEPTLVGTRA